MIHDGTIILNVSPELCELFRCDEIGLIDRAVESIIADDEMRAMARLRGRMIQEKGEERVFHQGYPFIRCDGSTFWGEAISQRQYDGNFKTVVKWEYDISRT